VFGCRPTATSPLNSSPIASPISSSDSGWSEAPHRDPARLEDVWHRYGQSPAGTTGSSKAFTSTLRPGELVGLLGHRAAAKTTLLRLIAWF